MPTVFVTNAGNTIRRKKAEQLSSWLGVEVDEDQVCIIQRGYYHISGIIQPKVVLTMEVFDSVVE